MLYRLLRQESTHALAARVMGHDLRCNRHNRGSCGISKYKVGLSCRLLSNGFLFVLGLRVKQGAMSHVIPHRQRGRWRLELRGCQNRTSQPQPQHLFLHIARAAITLRNALDNHAHRERNASLPLHTCPPLSCSPRCGAPDSCFTFFVL